MQNSNFYLYDSTKNDYLRLIEGNNEESAPISKRLDAEKVQKTKEKITRQIGNIYRSTRMVKYTLKEVGSHTATVLEYKKIKGLVLNIEKRICWYLNLKPEEIKCLTVEAQSQSAKTDLKNNDFASGKFHYYIKAIITDGEQKFNLCLPLIGLNIKVI